MGTPGKRTAQMTDLQKRTSDLDFLIQKSKNYIVNSVSASTRKAYSSDWNNFCSFCESKGLNFLPSMPETVSVWVTHLFETGRKPSTIQRALTSIAQAHKLNDLESPINELVRKTVSGIRRESRHIVKKSAPLLADHLVRISENLLNDIIGKRDKAIILFGWAGALRRSEIVAINFDDLEFLDSGISVRIRSSKTDQLNDGYKIGIPFAENQTICPVRSMISWIGISEIDDGPVFRFLGPSARNRIYEKIGPRRLSARSISIIVKRSCELAGYLPNGFSGHSLRSGFITEAASQGVPERLIMRHTRHKSIKVMREYIHDGSIFSDNPLTGLI